ncbi:AraC family transcriptional regulator [Salsuginibacillus kocurii]|uniref:AraC family transcriptional regulator n=1 Tax=Salsuginibacillus kocurii TaxID=427078 RepID=UPI00037BAF2F|nr:AraC family transcriptional regulator [Salsuginibacillus kocurii]
MKQQKAEVGLQGVTLYEAKHPEHHVIDNHHHSTHQIIYVLEGNGSCTLDGIPYDMKQDNIVLIAPYSNHSITSFSKMTNLVLEFNEQTVEQTVQEQLLKVVFQQSKVASLSLVDSKELRQLLRKMLYEQAYGDAVKDLALNLFLAQILFVLYRCRQTVQVTDTNTLRVSWLRNYIDTHYYEIETSTDLANKIGMSTRYIHSIFKEYYEVTPMQYLTEVRLNLVKRMLLESNKDVASICFEVGFESVSTFYRVFKKHVGMPPSHYRSLYKQDQLEHFTET